MSVYNNSQIRAAIDAGNIICVPFNPAHVSVASLDLTVGYHYYRLEHRHQRTVYNPLEREDVERYYDGPYQAMPHGEWAKLHGLTPLTNIPLTHPVISLKPGERILAHSHEFVGIHIPGAAEIHGRTSWSQNGIAVCLDGDWIEPGFIGRLTLTIQNLNERETILLPVGERLAQVVFHDGGEVDGSARDVLSSKYRTGSDLDTIIKTWSPDKLLPKAYLDQRELPSPIEGALYD